MVSNYRVRFAPVRATQKPLQSHTCGKTIIPQNPKSNPSKRQSSSKSHFGCIQCKVRHLKCDETFPVCLRCQRRNSNCKPAARKVRWQAELPWLSQTTIDNSLGTQLSNADRRLLQCWLETTCQIMVIDPEHNPMSFPIVEHLAVSQSLLHTIQSISAAHEIFFDASKNLTTCLQERGHAIGLIQTELRSYKPKSLPAIFLSVFMLGISSSWIDGSTGSFGVEHLLGGRALIDLIIEKRDSIPESSVNFTVGCYLYWDMATSFLVSPGLLRPINTPEIHSIVKNMRHLFHPIAGYSTEIFYLLGTLGRHCRNVLSGGPRDLLFEAALEEEMLEWEQSRDDWKLSISADAFRNHGLIMLYRICGCQIHVSLHEEESLDGDDEVGDAEYEEDHERNPQNEELESPSDGTTTATNPDTEIIIRAYAVKTIHAISSIPISSPHINLQSIPLLTAGSELTLSDSQLREEVIARFRALYSLNRIPTNIHAVGLLREIWEIRDRGVKMSWLELELAKGWRLSFA